MNSIDVFLGMLTYAHYIILYLFDQKRTQMVHRVERCCRMVGLLVIQVMHKRSGIQKPAGLCCLVGRVWQGSDLVIRGILVTVLVAMY